MEPEQLQTLLLAAGLVGAVFSGAVGTWRRGPAVGIRCALAAAALFAASVLPFWATLGGIMFRLS